MTNNYSEEEMDEVELWDESSVLCRSVVGNRRKKSLTGDKNHNMVVISNGTGGSLRRKARTVVFKRKTNGI